jgi:hypothetical protein
MSKYVFISHSSADKKIAIALCHYLEERKIKCWIAPRDISIGKDYGAAIIDGIELSSIMIVIFTNAANKSKFVKNEIERAFNYQLVIMPFRIENIQPSKSLELFLSSTHWLDAIDGNYEKKFEDLYINCAKILGKEIIKIYEDGSQPPPRILEQSIKINKKQVLIFVTTIAIIISTFLLIPKKQKILEVDNSKDTLLMGTIKKDSTIKPDSLNQKVNTNKEIGANINTQGKGEIKTPSVNTQGSKEAKNNISIPVTGEVNKNNPGASGTVDAIKNNPGASGTSDVNKKIPGGPVTGKIDDREKRANILVTEANELFNKGDIGNNWEIAYLKYKQANKLIEGSGNIGYTNFKKKAEVDGLDNDEVVKYMQWAKDIINTHTNK